MFRIDINAYTDLSGVKNKIVQKPCKIYCSTCCEAIYISYNVVIHCCFKTLVPNMWGTFLPSRTNMVILWWGGTDINHLNPNKVL